MPRHGDTGIGGVRERGGRVHGSGAIGHLSSGERAMQVVNVQGGPEKNRTKFNVL